MTNQAYHHLKAACVKANNETAMCHLDHLWRKELDRRQLQRYIDYNVRRCKRLNIDPLNGSYAY